MRATLRALLRPLALLAVLAALTVGLVTQVPIRADLAILLPERQSEELALLQRALREGPANRTVMIGLRPAEPVPDDAQRFARLAELSRALKGELQASDRFERVANGSFALDDAALQPFLQHRYRLNPPLDPASFTQEGLGKALDRLLVELRGFGAPLIERIMAEDPTLRTLEVARLWRQSGGPRKEQGVWVGRDGQRAVLLARSRRNAFDAAGQTDVLDAVQRAIGAVEAEHGAVATQISGPSVIAVQSRNTGERESRRLLAWSVPAVALILLLAFRRVTVLAASAVPLLAGFAAGTAGVAGVFGEVLAPTLGFGAILIGVGVDYPLHLFGHRRPDSSAAATARRIWPTLALGAATTAIGFLPLVLSSFPGVAQLGVFTIAGLAVAAAVTRWLLPWAVEPIALPPAAAVWDRAARLHAVLGRGRIAALLLGAAAVGVLLLRGDGLWQDDLRALSPLPAETRQQDQALRDDLAATNPRYLLTVAGADAQQVLAREQALLPTLQRLRADGVLDGFELTARYLSSAASQAERLQALPERAELRRRLDAALADRPFEAGTFEPFVDALAGAKAAGPLRPEQIDAPLLRARLDTLMVATDDGRRGFAFVEGLRDEARLRDTVAAADVPGVRLLDLKAETEALLHGYRSETLRWIALGAALGALALGLGLRRLTAVAAVGGAVLVSVAATAALLVLAGTALTLFHLLGLMVVAGLGLDYAIFLRRAAREDAAGGGRDGRRSVAICAATSVAVFAILSGAQIPMLGQLGDTVALGAAVSLLAAAAFTGAARRN